MFLFRKLAPWSRVGAAALMVALALSIVAPATHQARAASQQSLSIGWSTETKTLDPGATGQNPDIWVMVNIYDALLRLGPDGKTIQPNLATSYAVAKDGKTYTFRLRKGVKFHDGSTLTSSDVQFSLMRTATKNPGWSFLYKAVKAVDAPNPTTLVVHLKYPWGPFLADMTFFAGGVYPAAYFKKVGAKGLAQHPIGTGPYQLDTWRKGQYLRLKKNAAYWDAASYPLQQVEYDLIPSDNTRLLKVQAGELDVDNVLPYNQVAALKGNSAATAQINTSTETQYFTFNTKVKPFNDVNVRQAISHAINRAALAKAVTYGLGTPANSFIPYGALYYNAGIPLVAYDVALAKSLLAKSTVPHGFSMTMETNAGDTVGNEEAQILQQELAPLGIKMTIKQVDPTTLFNNQQLGKYNFTTNLWTNDIPDPDELASFAMDYTAGNGSFYTFYNNPVANTLSHTAEQTNDTATRKNAYYKIQEQWAKDQPFVALYYVPFVNAVSTKVHGFSENPLGYFNLRGVTKS